ncbi:MAG: excinuclease ABC subunit UvrB [Clostridiales bacterium]|nr:excinuclease ABC subunit UvrB [Clostridiales bacterium]
MNRFKLHSEYTPSGDQPKAIDEIVKGLKSGKKAQTLLGVTGSGKTFAMANVIERVQRPTLVLAHNKILAAQLCAELKSFFPENAVEFFVSYYDYYQPEAYIPHTDTYIEKETSINNEIDRLRHSATAALLERRDVIVVSSVSCIYSIGDPDAYKRSMVSLRPGMTLDRDELIEKLTDINYKRNDIDFKRNTYRVRGDIVDVLPANTEENAVRVEFFGDEIDRLCEINSVTGEIIGDLNHMAIFPATHFVMDETNKESKLEQIELDMEDRVRYFKENNKLIEAQRIRERTNYDLEMIREIGYCNGIENYSRYFDGRRPGEPAYTLIDFFPDDFVLMIDESHVTIPQVRGMYGGDLARKKNLVEYGFRLESAYDNRPLKFEEFEKKMPQTVFVSATPGKYEDEHSDGVAELIVRPTGLCDPEVEVHPTEGQIDHLIGEIRKRKLVKERTIVVTLTIRMAESLTHYLEDAGIKVKYLHHNVDTMERMELIRDFRKGDFDVLVGINLLREGIDVPEASLMAILDADKEGFLRSETSLIQTMGRAARNVNGRVIMYADNITDSMQRAMDETARRREIQMRYNKEHSIVPQTVKKEIRDVIDIHKAGGAEKRSSAKKLSPQDINKEIQRLTADMQAAAKALNFEQAAVIRDMIIQLKSQK